MYGRRIMFSCQGVDGTFGVVGFLFLLFDCLVHRYWFCAVKDMGSRSFAFRPIPTIGW